MVEGVSHTFSPEERPLVVGSPYLPAHPLHRRLGYATVALLTGIGSTFPNGLVTVNVPNLAGGLGADLAELTWLPALFVAFSATGNLILVKARAQFGIPRVMDALLAAYLLAAFAQLFWPSFVTAALTRAANGLAAAALITITIYYLQQVFPAKLRPLALICGLSLTQLGPALARMVPVELLTADHWRGLHMVEIAAALALFTALTALPLPPSDRSKVFEPLDFVTIALAVPAMLLLCTVLAEGRILWWIDTPWLGWALAAAIPLFAAAFLVESQRARPLLQTNWIGTKTIFRFFAVALLMRLALAEQTYGSVGLLTSGGLNNDQLRDLFALVAIAMLLGMVTAALTLSPQRLLFQVLVAAIAISLAGWLDSFATNLTRPHQLYLSQALIGFGTTLFIGPTLAAGFLRMLDRGKDHFITLVVVFSTSQNVGGLVGSALLGSYQTIATHYHILTLSESLLASDPQVLGRIQAGTVGLASTIGDPVHQAVQGAGLLSNSLAREASILAYNDTFRLVGLLALITAVYVAYLLLLAEIRRRKFQRVPA